MKLNTKKTEGEKWTKHRKYEPISYGVVGYSDEYICEHGIGHDMGVHGCDGCCSDPTFKELFNL